MAAKRREAAPYHHGDLPRALVDAAVAIIEKSGVEGLALKDAASRAGVSHAAVYRHFADKHALLVGVAERGFERFGVALAAAVASAPSPRTKASFLHVGRAVVQFAAAEPVLYRVMYSGTKRWTLRELAAAPAETAFGQLLAFIGELQHAGVLRRGDAMRQAVAIWATSHGLATLVAAGAQPGSGAERARMADEIHTTLLEGLAPR
jgi:AcrR family transcriptional regulator